MGRFINSAIFLPIVPTLNSSDANPIAVVYGDRNLVGQSYVSGELGTWRK